MIVKKLFVLLALLFGLWVNMLAQAPDHVLIAEADATISGRDDGNYQHGNPNNPDHTLLIVKNEGEPGPPNSYYREVILRFDLSSVDAEIEKAVLQLYKKEAGLTAGAGEPTADTVQVGVWFVPDDNWDEKTVTWSTAPIPNVEVTIGQLLCTKKKEVDGKKIFTWNEDGVMQADVVEKERKGDGKITFDLYGITKKLVFTDPEPWTAFIARDSVGADSLHPRLLLWTKGSETKVNIRETNLPSGYALMPNFPNPFNPMTSITYQLKGNETATLVIYNETGQNVFSFDNMPQTAGIHTVQWDGRFRDGRAAPSGVYFVQLKAGDFVETRKMVLLQ